jgi:hypothetical protein
MAKSKDVDKHIGSLEGDAQRLARDLRAMVFAVAPAATEAWKWSRPCYALAKPFCSFQVCKQHISLAFEQGASLHDPEHLLEGTGTAMRHVKIPLTTDRIPQAIHELLERAVTATPTQ